MNKFTTSALLWVCLCVCATASGQVPEKDNQLQYALKMLRGEPLPPTVPRPTGPEASVPAPAPAEKQ